MGQAQAGIPTSYCPFCGAPVGAAGARFCAACGRDLATGAPSAGPAPTTAAGPAPAPGPYAAPAPGHYAPAAPAQMVMVQSPPRSRGVAILLEVLLAGAGALYLGRIGQGLAWLFGTVIASVIVAGIDGILSQGAAAQCADLNPDTFCTPDYSAIQTFVVVVALLGLAWLITRLVIVSNQATAMERQRFGAPTWAPVAVVAGAPVAGGWQATPAPAPAGPLTISAARMIWVGVGLVALLVAPTVLFDQLYLRLLTSPVMSNAIFWLFVLAGYPLTITTSFGAVAAYLLAARRLATASWGRALAEALGLELALAVASTVIWIIYYSLTGGFDFGRAFMQTLLRLFVAYAFAALIGVGFAAWSAPWRSIRLRVRPSQRIDMKYTGILFVIAAALAGVSNVALPAGAYSVAHLILALGLAIGGAALAAQWLNQQVAQLAASPSAPAPVSPTAPSPQPVAPPPAEPDPSR